MILKWQSLFNPIRMMDPVFREKFENHKKINMVIEEIPKGAHVIETSEDSEIVKLKRQHAHKAVSEFVEDGMSRAMKSTELSMDYKDN